MRQLACVTIAAVLWVFAAGCGADECEDKDGDGFFAATSSCKSGRDCDDSRPSVSPDEDEVCGNGRDDNCNGKVDECDGTGGADATGDAADGFGADVGADGRVSKDGGFGTDGSRCSGSDATCPGSCVDRDGDGWGAEGQTAGCPESGPDCNDDDDQIHPGAQEVCNGRDDDCDGNTDECASPQGTCQSVDGESRCIVPVGAECSSSDQCPKHTACDSGIDPSECRNIRGETCGDSSECRSSLACSGGRCSGSYCQSNSCSGDRDVCDDSEERCAECRYWYDDPPGERPKCNFDEVCLGKGACGGTATIDESGSVSPYPSVTRDVLDVARELAICWRNLSDGDPAMCIGFETTDALSDAVTESDVRTAYEELDNAAGNDNLQEFSDQNLESLKNLLGEAALNSDDLAWDRDIPPNSEFEVCAWYDDHGTFSPDKLHVGPCDAFSW